MTNYFTWSTTNNTALTDRDIYNQLMAAYASPKKSRPKVPEVPAEPAPTIEGSIIGYRAWRIKDWKLTGTGVNRAWEPGINEATCDAGPSDFFGVSLSIGSMLAKPHTAPGEDCHCGINALARFTRKDEHWEATDVFGAIEAWSELPDAKDPDGHEGFLLHPTGFRARYGKVVLLAVDDAYPRAQNAAIRALAAEHGADICKREHLEQAAQEHGSLVPDEMLAWAKANQPKEPERVAYGGSFASGGMIMPAWATSAWSPITTPPVKPKNLRQLKSKGIKQTLGYVGAPGYGKHKRGDRVADRNGTVYLCVRGGQPGTWELDA